LELGFEAAIGEIPVHSGIDAREFTFGAVFDGFGKDCSGIIVVNDHDVFVSFARCDLKTSSLVGINLSSYRHYFGIH
jgi:hypothetical protein